MMRILTSALDSRALVGFMSYLPPTPPLQLIRFRIELPHEPEGPQAVTVCTQRANPSFAVARCGPSASWSDPDDHGIPGRLGAPHRLGRTQDRPNTSERLLFALTGGLGIQEPLF